MSAYVAHDLIDIGANLTHDSFDRDRAEVIRRARNAGVAIMVVTGADEDSSHAAARLAEAYPGVLYATAGVHPHHAKDWQDTTAATLEGLLTHSEVRAVGECGLDYCRNFSTHEQQEAAFATQLQLAVATSLPAFLHQRDAHRRFIEIFDDYRSGISRAVAHCFTGNGDELADLVERDLYIGITGWICDERRGHHLRDIVGMIPPERLMIETDAPYLLPRDLDPRPKTRRNEPCHLPHILEVVAKCLGRDPEAVAAQSSANARRFFDLTKEK